MREHRGRTEQVKDEGLSPNAGGEFRRDSDVNSTALLADSGGDK